MMTGKQFSVRLMLTVSLPFILIYAAAAEFWCGIASAFRYAWLEVRIEVDSYRKHMRREDY